MMAHNVLSGLLLPESFMHSRFFIILATLVALNTVIYAALSLVQRIMLGVFAAELLLKAAGGGPLPIVRASAAHKFDGYDCCAEGALYEQTFTGPAPTCLSAGGAGMGARREDFVFAPLGGDVLSPTLTLNGAPLIVAGNEPPALVGVAADGAAPVTAAPLTFGYVLYPDANAQACA